MIPKVIHYCWFGEKKLPISVKKCIASWRKYCPDYEIVEWNEHNFDIHINKYVEKAYSEKKWAFVSDFARFFILYNYGGIYVDTDVEFLRNIDFVLDNYAFAAQEDIRHVAPGLIMGSEKENIIIGDVIEYYENSEFVFSNRMPTVVTIFTDILRKYGYREVDNIQDVQNITIYPTEYFCPMDFETREVNITEKTCSIHHYDDSWHSINFKIYMKLKKHIKRFGL